MAAINDLIAQIENSELRARIQAEVDRMNKQKKFGLVFEEHLPECTPLYDIPIKKGALVALKTGRVSEVYRVLKIKGDEAECKKKDAGEVATFKVNELVTIAEFGEPIYPCLKLMCLGSRIQWLCEIISVNSPTVIKFEIIGSSENSAPVFVQHTTNAIICQGVLLQISLIKKNKIRMICHGSSAEPVQIHDLQLAQNLAPSPEAALSIS